MSAVADGVRDTGRVIRAVAAPVVAPIVAAGKLVAHGDNPLKSVGQEIGRDINVIKDKVVAPVVQGISQGMGQDQALPDITVEDPGAKAVADAKSRAAAKRKAEKDILQGQPGRGGTILTDSYKYNV